MMNRLGEREMGVIRRVTTSQMSGLYILPLYQSVSTTLILTLSTDKEKQPQTQEWDENPCNQYAQKSYQKRCFPCTKSNFLFV